MAFHTWQQQLPVSQNLPPLTGTLSWLDHLCNRLTGENQQDSDTLRVIAKSVIAKDNVCTMTYEEEDTRNVYTFAVSIRADE